jgi:hypothetical protein
MTELFAENAREAVKFPGRVTSVVAQKIFTGEEGMSCKIKIENFEKISVTADRSKWHRKFSYFWNCPSCNEDQVELEEPEVGQAVQCEDCEIFVEVVR